jgi:hypothetical protein
LGAACYESRYEPDSYFMLDRHGCTHLLIKQTYTYGSLVLNGTISRQMSE